MIKKIVFGILIFFFSINTAKAADPDTGYIYVGKIYPEGSTYWLISRLDGALLNPVGCTNSTWLYLDVETTGMDPVIDADAIAKIEDTKWLLLNAKTQTFRVKFFLVPGTCMAVGPITYQKISKIVVE